MDELQQRIEQIERNPLLKALHQIANLGTCAGPRKGGFQRAIDIAVAAISQPADPWLPLQSAPKDCTMVWLLVDYRDEGEHALVDDDFAATIGFNNDDNVGEGEGEGWQFAGWCWTHDHFTDGHGKVLAWKPIGFALQPPSCFRPLGETGTA